MISLDEASRRLNEALSRLEGTLSARVKAQQDADSAVERLQAEKTRLRGLNSEAANELDGAIRRLRALLGE